MRKSSIIGILVAVLVIAIAAGIGWYSRRSAEPPPPVAAKTAPAPKPQETPSFDIVRVEQGHAVIAGRAPPGSKVTVLDGDKVIGEVTANERGEWALSPDQTLAPGNHELSISAKLPDGRTLTSEHVVVVVVPEPKVAEQDKGALAVAVPRKGPGASRVLQRPGAAARQGALTLETVDYDQTGQIVLSGRGAPGTAVHGYLDNQFLGRAPIGVDGQWKLVPESKVEPGLYNLRLDQVNAAGKVGERLIIPFSRANPERMPPGSVVVQLGNSLWEIARQEIGEPTRYTVIYQANKDQIANPDLIYTGQVFTMPDKKKN